MPNKAELVGYVRKSATGNALKLNINKGAFSKAEFYTGRDGEEYVSLIVSLDKVKMLIGDQKEVTSICQIVDIDEELESQIKTEKKNCDNCAEYMKAGDMYPCKECPRNGNYRDHWKPRGQR